MVAARLLAAVAIALLALSPTFVSAAEAKPEKPAPEKLSKEAEQARAARQQTLRTMLLDHFCLGVEAPTEWQAEVRKVNGARFDFTLGYLSTGVGHNDTPWFLKYGGLEQRMVDAKTLGMGCWFTWYMLSQSAPADWKPGPAQASPANAKVAATMKEYFECFKTTLLVCAKHPDVPMVMQIEPDEWCHLLISGHMDPAKVEVKVGSCGMPELKGLPDDEYGYAKALARLRDLYAPAVLLCCNPSGWDWQNSMSGVNLGKIFKDMCVPDYELADLETCDRDKGMGKPPPYGDSVMICQTMPNHIAWISDFHKTTGLYVALWQVSVGNTYFASCDNSKFHYCDNLSQYLLEDYPKNDAIARYVAAGCCGCFFNGCIPGFTAVWDQAKDGITNPKPIPGNQGHKSEYADDDGGFMRLFGAAYYKHPYPILGKPLTAKAEDRPRPLESKPVKPMVTDPKARKAYDATLQKRLGDELAAKRHPKLNVAALASSATIEAIDGAQLSLRLGDGAHLDLPWSALAPSDLAQLAEFVVRDAHPEDHALAAFYLLLEGEPIPAEQHLSLAGDGADSVRHAFAAN
jgi:hypothetical protein